MAEMTINGLRQVIDGFGKAPRAMKKACRKALASAARATARGIRKKIPARWRRLVKSKAKESKGKKMYANAGLYFDPAAIGGHQPKGYAAGEGVTDWFKAYWLNYGTLAGRDTSHHFERKVKNGAKTRKQRHGVKATNFFEASVRGWESGFVDKFSESLKEQGYSLK